jgi:outer membrane lipoprotein-sorting protein
MNFLLKSIYIDPPDKPARHDRKKLNEVRILCGKENVSLSIEETDESSGRYFENVIGDLKNNQTLSEKLFTVTVSVS